MPSHSNDPSIAVHNHSYSLDEFTSVLLDATPLPLELIGLVASYRLLHRRGPLFVSPCLALPVQTWNWNDDDNEMSDALETLNYIHSGTKQAMPFLLEGRLALNGIDIEGYVCHEYQLTLTPAT